MVDRNFPEHSPKAKYAGVNDIHGHGHQKHWK
jgi:hypothetical protein